MTNLQEYETDRFKHAVGLVNRLKSEYRIASWDNTCELFYRGTKIDVDQLVVTSDEILIVLDDGKFTIGYFTDDDFDIDCNEFAKNFFQDFKLYVEHRY